MDNSDKNEELLIEEKDETVTEQKKSIKILSLERKLFEKKGFKDIFKEEEAHYNLKVISLRVFSVLLVLLLAMQLIIPTPPDDIFKNYSDDSWYSTLSSGTVMIYLSSLSEVDVDDVMFSLLYDILYDDFGLSTTDVNNLISDAASNYLSTGLPAYELCDNGYRVSVVYYDSTGFIMTISLRSEFYQAISFLKI